MQSSWLDVQQPTPRPRGQRSRRDAASQTTPTMEHGGKWRVVRLLLSLPVVLISSVDFVCGSE